MHTATDLSHYQLGVNIAKMQQFNLNLLKHTGKLWDGSLNSIFNWAQMQSDTKPDIYLR